MAIDSPLSDLILSGSREYGFPRPDANPDNS
jgi:predicted nucleotidyltransferase